MKKITILVLLFAFLSVNIGLAAETAVKNDNIQTVKTSDVKKDIKIFSKIKKGVTDKVNQAKETYNKISEKLNNVSGGMRTALILMVVGLVFLILAGPIGGGSIVYAVGAIFFLIGAILLLLEIL